MDIIKITKEAEKKGIDLGSNPIRTIRYYISFGLLEKPQLEQVGKKRFLMFRNEHLMQLETINQLKKQGMSLKDIKEKINDMVFWSDYALNLIDEYREEIPEGSFRKGKPIIRQEMAFFISRFFMDDSKERLNTKSFKELIVDKFGQSIEFPGM